ncbi:hypothetical protein FOC1_g10001310 [Fusarium oxysporum f. sp. cubense race 1]|uniref:Uncharacterized protein n=1 Tax=Fusarium oxysporum f. sp. cubense (strain race 1) TaxID=1229664 RepID=N4TN85_FUSC1|nr:hypothetical protein FOC1_g10001310 [Fusarium oxysporum f. sp. cubense race 1]
MATSPIDLDGVKAAVGYEYDGTTRFVSRPDSEHLPIRFTLHLDATCALFDVVIPIVERVRARRPLILGIAS